MRKFIPLIFIFIIIMTQGCLFKNKGSFVVSKHNDSQILSNPFIWDFGRIKQGAIVKHSFKITNNTDKVLNIKGTNSSCGCTVSSLSKNIIFPGEHVFIEAKFNSKGYSGPIEQFIYVNTDDLDNSIIKLIIRANVEK